jgi:hypothetical protein
VYESGKYLKCLLQSSSKASGIPKIVTKLGKYCFYGNQNITSLTVPNTVVNIGESAFESCSKLESIILPSELETLGTECFYKCYNLTSIKCNKATSVSLQDLNNIKGIGVYAFNYCALTDVDIPSNVESISFKAFGNIDSLGNVKFYKCYTATKIDPVAFDNAGADGNLVFEVPWTKEDHLETFKGTYTELGGVEKDRDLFFGAKKGSKIQFKDGTVITKIKDGIQTDITEE